MPDRETVERTNRYLQQKFAAANQDLTSALQQQLNLTPTKIEAEEVAPVVRARLS